MTAPRDPATLSIDRATLEAEVARILDATEPTGTPVRILGSIAVSIRCPTSAALLAPSRRRYADIDMAAYRRGTRSLSDALVGLGYIDDREVFAASEGARSIFDDPARNFHLDVFYDRLEFCHIIPLAGRLEADRPTIPLAELLVSKLQIVKINEKDLVDVMMLLLDHPLGDADGETIDMERIGRLAGADWGLWRTLTQNLEKVDPLAAHLPDVDAVSRDRLVAATRAIKTRIDDEPKSLAWRMRDRVGDRRQWWTDVDEVR